MRKGFAPGCFHFLSILQRGLHLGTDLSQIGAGLLCTLQNRFHLRPLFLSQVILRQQLRVALDDGQRRFQLVGQLNDLLPLPLLHVPLLLQAPVNSSPMVCNACKALSYSRTFAPENTALSRSFRATACAAAVSFRSPGSGSALSCGCSTPLPYQQQNAQNAVHGLHIRQHARSAGSA